MNYSEIIKGMLAKYTKSFSCLQRFCLNLVVTIIHNKIHLKHIHSDIQCKILINELPIMFLK